MLIEIIEKGTDREIMVNINQIACIYQGDGTGKDLYKAVIDFWDGTRIFTQNTYHELFAALKHPESNTLLIEPRCKAYRDYSGNGSMED